MTNREDGGVSIIFSMSCITIIVILMSITFISVRIERQNADVNGYYSSPLTQEQIDESFKKFQQREAVRKSSTKEK
jgi:hypothetical protein